MKKFTKLFLSCAAVAAISAAIGISAMAAGPVAIKAIGTNGLTGSYDPDTNKITALTIGGDVTVTADSQVTFLVYEKGDDDTTVASTAVVGIDQNTYSTTVVPANNGLMTSVATKAADETTGYTYVVKVGYYDAAGFKTATGEFKLGKAVETTTITIGNVLVDEDDDPAKPINAGDTVAMARYLASLNGTGDTGTVYQKADGSGTIMIGNVLVDEDDDPAKPINAGDTVAMARYLAGLNGTGDTGKTVEVIVPEA